MRHNGHSGLNTSIHKRLDLVSLLKPSLSRCESSAAFHIAFFLASLEPVLAAPAGKMIECRNVALPLKTGHIYLYFQLIHMDGPVAFKCFCG